MTEWQWRVIVAICRVLLLIVARHPRLDRDLEPVETRDQFANDMAYLEEAANGRYD